MVDAQSVADAMQRDNAASQALGITVDDVGPGYATTSMEVTDAMNNGFGVCHGGLIFLLADAAMALAGNSHNQMAMASGATVDFINPAIAGVRLKAEASEVLLRGRSGVYDVVVSDNNGTTIAVLRGRTRQVGRVVVEETT